METTTVVAEQVLRQGLTYVIYGGLAADKLIAFIKKLIGKQPQSWNVDDISSRCGISRQGYLPAFSLLLPSNFLGSGNTVRAKQTASLAVMTIEDRWLQAYQLVIDSLKNEYSDLDLMNEACLLLQESVADGIAQRRDFQHLYWYEFENLFHLAAITEILGSNSERALNDAKSYWYCLLRSRLDWTSCFTIRHMDFILLALMSIARIERRLGHHAMSIEILTIIADCRVGTEGSNWELPGVEKIQSVDFMSAIANPHVFDQIDPNAWHSYILKRQGHVAKAWCDS